MRVPRKLFLPVLALAVLSAAAVLLFSCGGGGSSSSAPPTAVTRGAITGFGSIWVNGVEFETSADTVRTHPDDNSADIDSPDNVAFRPGMVVTVRYRTSDNTATSVTFRNDLSGPIGTVDPAASTFTVLGFTVHADNTYYDGFGDGATFASLAVGTVVEVSGLPDNAGVLQATFVDNQADAASPGDVFEVKGYVSNLNTTDNTFALNLLPGTSTGGVLVSYTGAAVEGMPVGGIAEGLFVEVKTASTGAPLAATAVEGAVELSDDCSGAEKVSVSGFVSGLAGDAVAGYSFFVGGQAVYVAPGTTGIGLVAANAKLDVEGPLDASGVLQAVKVEPEL